MLYNPDLIIHIVRKAFRNEHGGQDRYHRLAYLEYIYQHMYVCRAWRYALQPYLKRYLVIRLWRRESQNMCMLSKGKLASMARKWPSALMSGGHLKKNRVAMNDPVGYIRMSDGSIVSFVTNLPHILNSRIGGKGGPEHVQTILLAVKGELDQRHVDEFLKSSQLLKFQWNVACTLCVQMDIGPGRLGWEKTVQKILSRAPNIRSCYMVRPVQTLAQVQMSLDNALGQYSGQLERVEIQADISCFDIPASLPELTSLSLWLSISMGGSVAKEVPRLVSKSLQRLTLYNVNADVLFDMFLGDKEVVFNNLLMLKLSLHIHLFGGIEEEEEEEQERRRFIEGGKVMQKKLVFPRLESTHIFGYQRKVPEALFMALSESPVKHLYIYLALRSSEHMELPRMKELVSLRLYLPQLDDIQPVLDSALTEKTELQSMVIYTHMRLEGTLPEKLLLKNMRNLNLGALISMGQMWQVVRQLPRLTFLRIMLAKDSNLDDQVQMADAKQLVRAKSSCPISTTLQVLLMWHYEPFVCVNNQICERAAQTVALLASIKSLDKFKCRSNTQALSDILQTMLEDQEIATQAGHLSQLYICPRYE